MPDALHHFRARSFTHRVEPGVPPASVRARDANLDQLVCREGVIEFVDDGVGQAVLTDAYYGMAVMGTRAQESDLTGVQHGGHSADAAENGGAIVTEQRSPFDEVKIDLGAILVVAAIGAPLVMWLLSGPLEWILLGGYGAGAGLWLYCRTRGVLAAAHASRLERTGGTQQ